MVSGIGILGTVTATLASWLTDRLREETAAAEQSVLTEVHALRTEIQSLREQLAPTPRCPSPGPRAPAPDNALVGDQMSGMPGAASTKARYSAGRNGQPGSVSHVCRTAPKSGRPLTCVSAGQGPFLGGGRYWV